MAVLAGAVGLAGCTPWATYPKIEGAGDITNANLPPIPELMALSVLWGAEHYPEGVEATDGVSFYYNLPEGTPAKVFRRVETRMGEGDPLLRAGIPAYHVQMVRVRTVEAEVDLIAPRTDGLYDLVTLQFKQHITKGWRVIDHRVWRVRVDVPGPAYRPDGGDAEAMDSSTDEADEASTTEGEG